MKGRFSSWMVVWCGCLFLLPGAPAEAKEGTPITARQAAAAFFEKGQYAELDALAASIRAKGYDVFNTYPELYTFYRAFSLENGATDTEWLERRKVLEAWATAAPDSISARIALADWWIGYGWKARGSGYARTVAPEGWKALAERLAEAEKILREVPVDQVDDPEYFRLWTTVALGQGWPVAKARRYFNYGVEKAKSYYLLYSGFAYRLLPKWYGEEGDWEAFVKEAADTFPGAQGDILYGKLVESNSGDYGDALFAQCALDYPRIQRGLEALIAGSDPLAASHAKNRLCYYSAIRGDHKVARPLFFEIRASQYPSFFRGIDNLRRLRAESGAQALIDGAYALEKRGDLAGAEKAFASFTADPETNAWLRLFYQRQGMEAKLRMVKTRYALDADPATADPNALADLCRVAPLMGQWEKAEAAGRRLDALRPWNLTGKTALLLVAARKGDRAEAEAIRKAIIETKSDRPAFQTVQAVMRGEKSWDDAWAQLNEEGRYNKQSAVALGAWLAASGDSAQARKAFETILAADEREDTMIAIAESLLYGSLAPLLNPASSDTQKLPHS